MRVFGRRRLARTIRAITKKTPKEVGPEMTRQANILRGRAVAVAPELTRKMILSSKVTKRSNRGREIRVISFDTAYAVKQHEDRLNPGPITAAKSPTQDGAAGRKYLTRPFNNMVQEQTVEKAVAKALIRAITKATPRRSRKRR